MTVDDGANPQVRYSSLESGEVWPGEGNINDDPLFCGGWATAEVLVNDQQGFEEAFRGYSSSLNLSRESPCLSTGENGTNMGADTGRCDRRGEPLRRILLGAGTYQMEGLDLSDRLSLEGAGEP